MNVPAFKINEKGSPRVTVWGNGNVTIEKSWKDGEKWETRSLDLFPNEFLTLIGVFDQLKLKYAD